MESGSITVLKIKLILCLDLLSLQLKAVVRARDWSMAALSELINQKLPHV